MISSTALRRGVVGLLTAGSVLMFPATSLGDTFAIKATDANTWNPPARTIAKNDRIRWKNPSGRDHNITAYGGNWNYTKFLPEGGAVAKRFRRRGTYKFFCSFHADVEAGVCAGMCGQVTVTR